jgi:hypothetical protein
MLSDSIIIWYDDRCSGVHFAAMVAAPCLNSLLFFATRCDVGPVGNRPMCRTWVAPGGTRLCQMASWCPNSVYHSCMAQLGRFTCICVHGIAQLHRVHATAKWLMWGHWLVWCLAWWPAPLVRILHDAWWTMTHAVKFRKALCAGLSNAWPAYAPHST